MTLSAKDFTVWSPVSAEAIACIEESEVIDASSEAVITTAPAASRVATLAFCRLISA